MLRILLIRHGETEWNRERRIMGTEAIGLNETGRLQSLHMKEALGGVPVDLVYSSPVLRARETAEVLCEERDLDPLLDKRLEEIAYGEWVGKTFEEVQAMPGYTPYYKRLDTPVAPQGETLYQVRDRAMAFTQDIKKNTDAETVLVVSHADWIKVLVMEILEIPFQNIWKFRIDNVSVSLLESEKNWNRIICINQRGDFDRLFMTRFAF